MIKVAGLDISLRNLGVCIAEISADGAISVKDVRLIKPHVEDEKDRKKAKVRKNSDDLRRARWLRENMLEAIKDCDLVTIELPVGSQSARAMSSYGISLGVVASIEKSLIEVTPSDVKLAATGIRTASKEEMIEWAVEKHPEAPWKYKTVKGVKSLTADNEHCADALASIYAGMKTAEFKAIIKLMGSLKANS